jgi:HEAT repeat protein
VEYPVLIHEKVYSQLEEERNEATKYIRDNILFLDNRHGAWEDLHRLTQDNNDNVRLSAADTLRTAFSLATDKDKAWEDLHRLTQDNNDNVRTIAVYALGSAFSHVPDKDKAWEDLIKLTQDKNYNVILLAANALGSVYSLVPDKDNAWEDLVKLTKNEYANDVKRCAAGALGNAFSLVTDKDKAWEDLHRLTQDKNDNVRWGTADALRSAFPLVTDKDKAWEDLHRLTQDKNDNVRRSAADALRSAFPLVTDKDKAWEDLHRLTQDKNDNVRRSAAGALGNAFSLVTDKDKAWEDLHRLTQDKDYEVRRDALHSLGKMCIFNATKAESEKDMRSDLEKAIEYFEKSSLASKNYNPARFCLPFYRSFYTLTFKDEEEARLEVKKYLLEAKNAIGESKRKELLFTAVENLSLALEEAHNLKDKDIDYIQSNLDVYRTYCDTAAELLNESEKENPFASKLVKRGLPIIDVEIKKILTEIREKALAICKLTKGTAFEIYGKEVNKAGNQLDLRDSEGLKKSINNMIFILKSIYLILPEKYQTESIELIKRIDMEDDYGDKFNILLILLSKLQGVPYMSINITGNGNTVITGNRNNVESEYTPTTIAGDLHIDLEKLKQMIETDYHKDDKPLLTKKIIEAVQAATDPSKKELVKNNLNWILDKVSKAAPIGILITNILIHYKLM